jgi:hypothetical protein
VIAMGNNDKYYKFPPRKQVPVGGVCRLCECNRQIRKAARPYFKEHWSFRNIPPSSMIFKGVNNLTGEEEWFKLKHVQWSKPEFSSVERIK